MKKNEDLAILGDNHDVLLDTPYVGVYQFYEPKIGYIYWKKSVSFEEYKEGFEAMLKQHEKNPSEYFLSNIVNQGISSQEKKEWFKEVALQRAIKIGLKKGAVITDNNPFRKFYINIILGVTNTMGLPFKIFHDAKSAKEWLVSE